MTMTISSRFFNPEHSMEFNLRTLVQIFLFTGIKLGSRRSFISIALGYHSCQCAQRWWGIRLGRYRLAYRTKGDAKKEFATYYDSGIWWPWQVERTCSGFYL